MCVGSIHQCPEFSLSACRLTKPASKFYLIQTLLSAICLSKIRKEKSFEFDSNREEFSEEQKKKIVQIN